MLFISLNAKKQANPLGFTCPSKDLLSKHLHNAACHC